jgi:hypothetical protein
MARVPVITSPCPLRWKTMPSAGRDHCGQCDRQVHNLDGMNDTERASFFAACSGEVCVAYTIRRPHAFASLLTHGVAESALAGSVSAEAQPTGEQVTHNTVPVEIKGPTCDPMQLITVGGVKAAHDVEWIDERYAKAADPPAIQEIDAADWLPSPERAHAQENKR